MGYHTPEKSITVTCRRSPAAARGDTGPSAGGASLFWCAFSRTHRSCDPVLKKEIKYYMAEKLKIIPLGGLNEIGKNMTAY